MRSSRHHDAVRQHVRVLEHGAWQQVLVPLVYACIATAAPKLRADSRYFLAHAGLTQSNPPSFSRAEREVDHERIAASCWSTTSPATLPCSPLTLSTSSSSSSSEFAAQGVNARLGRPRVLRSTHRNAPRRRPTTRRRLGNRLSAWPVL